MIDNEIDWRSIDNFVTMLETQTAKRDALLNSCRLAAPLALFSIIISFYLFGFGLIGVGLLLMWILIVRVIDSEFVEYNKHIYMNFAGTFEIIELYRGLMDESQSMILTRRTSCLSCRPVRIYNIFTRL